MPRKAHLLSLSSYLLLIAFFFSACKSKKPTVFIEHQVGELFTLQIPALFHSTDHPSPYRTVMEYQNDSARESLIVFDTSRAGLHENTLKMYYDSMVSQLMIPLSSLKTPQFAMVNKDSAYKTEYTDTINGEKFFYELETIATPARYYTIITCGKLAQKEDLKDDMDKIMNSFRDINHVKL